MGFLFILYKHVSANLISLRVEDEVMYSHRMRAKEGLICQRLKDQGQPQMIYDPFSGYVFFIVFQGTNYHPCGLIKYIYVFCH